MLKQSHSLRLACSYLHSLSVHYFIPVVRERNIQQACDADPIPIRQNCTDQDQPRPNQIKSVCRYANLADHIQNSIFKFKLPKLIEPVH